MKGNKNEPLLIGPIHRNVPIIYIAYCNHCMHDVHDVVTQNITNFTRKEPVRIRARKEDTKLNAPSSSSQRQSIIQSNPSLSKSWTMVDGVDSHGQHLTGTSDDEIKTSWKAFEIETEIIYWFENRMCDVTFRVNVLCVFGTTYWVLGRHNKYQKWFYRNCYNVIWFLLDGQEP